MSGKLIANVLSVEVRVGLYRSFSVYGSLTVDNSIFFANFVLNNYLLKQFRCLKLL